MFRKALITAVAALAATAGTVAVATPAVAAAPSCSLTSPGHELFTSEATGTGHPVPGGYLCFVEDGDKVWVCDNYGDGWGVFLEVIVGGSLRYSLRADGSGNCSYAGVGDGYSSHDLPENATPITFHIYRVKGSSTSGSNVATYKNDGKY